MKVTNINKRADSSGRHNDRNFDVSKAAHIVQEKSELNKYYRYNGDENTSFNELEQKFYENNFEAYLNDANAKRKPKHPERIKTMEQYRTGAYTRPEDKILQIGNAKEHATGEELWACALEYKTRFEEIYGDNCVILDMALHMDEATPHVHIRRVWIAEDENGNKCVNQGKALEQLGIRAPKPNQPIGKQNNPKMTLTAVDTKLFRSVCIEHGLDIDDEKPDTRKKQQLEMREYKVSQDEKKIKEAITEIERLAYESPHLIEQHKEALENAKNVSESEYILLLISVMVNEFERLNRQGDFETVYKKEKLQNMEKFLTEQNLTSYYNDWLKDNAKDNEEISDQGREN